MSQTHFSTLFVCSTVTVWQKMIHKMVCHIFVVCHLFSTTEPRSDMRSSLRWATVASPRSYRAIFLIFCLQTFKAAFLWCVGVRRSKFRCPCKVVSKNHSVRSCTLTIASCIQRTFSEQAYQTRENSDKPQKSVVKKLALLCTVSEVFQLPNEHCK